MCDGNHGQENECNYKPNQLEEQSYASRALFNTDSGKLFMAFGYEPNPEAYLKFEGLSSYNPQRVSEE